MHVLLATDYYVLTYILMVLRMRHVVSLLLSIYTSTLIIDNNHNHDTSIYKRAHNLYSIFPLKVDK